MKNSVADSLKPNEIEIKVRFHEVDAIRIAHHANYFVWLECARFDFAEKILGLGYSELFKAILIPVTKIIGDYYYPVEFNDLLIIETYMMFNDTARFGFRYKIRNKSNGKKIFEGETHHVFLGEDFKLKLQTPEEIKQRINKARELYGEYFLELSSKKIR